MTSPKIADQAPPIPLDAVCALVADRYGLRVEASRLPGERDQNFRLRDEAGRSYVFKVHPRDEAEAVVALQTAALLQVAARDPDLATPRVCVDRQGAAYATALLEGEVPQFVRLLSWVEGGALADQMPLSTLQLQGLGRALARLDRALAGLDLADGEGDLVWDIQHAGRRGHLLGYIAEERLREAAAAALDRFVARAGPALPGLRRQAIHNDANLHNVRVDAVGQVCGVLDFGDMVVGPLINEVAVAAAYHIRFAEDVLAPIEAIAQGFHAVLPLEPAELDLLPDLILGRWMLSISIGSWRLHSGEADPAAMAEHLSTAEAPVRRLLALEPRAAGDRLRAALGVS